jgi:hypothetical protein
MTLIMSVQQIQQSASLKEFMVNYYGLVKAPALYVRCHTSQLGQAWQRTKNVMGKAETIP